MPATMFVHPGQHPFVIAGIIVLLLVIVTAKRASGASKKQTDQRRMFSSWQKQEAKRRAGGRCEHSHLGFRCKKPGEHADHIYPWSKGGATEMSNCQSLCARHNLQKSATIPTPFYIHRLQTRRTRYFPDGTPVRVEWRLGRAQSTGR